MKLTLIYRSLTQTAIRYRPEKLMQFGKGDAVRGDPSWVRLLYIIIVLVRHVPLLLSFRYPVQVFHYKQVNIDNVTRSLIFLYRQWPV